MNFSGEDQPSAHLDVRDIFGEEYAFRAGTVGTVAAKTAYGFVRATRETTGSFIVMQRWNALLKVQLVSSGRRDNTPGNRCYS